MFNEKCTFKKIEEDLKQAEKYLIFAKLAFKEYEKTLRDNEKLKTNVSVRKASCVLDQGISGAYNRLSGAIYALRWILKTDTVYVDIGCVNCDDKALDFEASHSFNCPLRNAAHHDEVMKRLEEAMKCFKTLVEASKVGEYACYCNRIAEWEEEGFKC